MRKLLLPVLASGLLFAGCGESSQPVKLDTKDYVYVYDEDGSADYTQVQQACNGNSPEEAVQLGDADDHYAYLVLCKPEDR